jgi:hypothetical protein
LRASGSTRWRSAPSCNNQRYCGDKGPGCDTTPLPSKRSLISGTGSGSKRLRSTKKDCEARQISIDTIKINQGRRAPAAAARAHAKVPRSQQHKPTRGGYSNYQRGEDAGYRVVGTYHVATGATLQRAVDGAQSGAGSESQPRFLPVKHYCVAAKRTRVSSHAQLELKHVDERRAAYGTNTG